MATMNSLPDVLTYSRFSNVLHTSEILCSQKGFAEVYTDIRMD